MALVNATKSGNWSDPTVWSTGSVPVNGDTVSAVTFAVELDIDFNQPNTILESTTGRFTFTANVTRTITARADSGNTSSALGIVRHTSSGTLIFNGNCRGSLTTANTYCFLNGGPGTFLIRGTATGGSPFGSVCAANLSTGRMEVDVAVGGTGVGSTTLGAVNSGAGTLIVGLAIGNDYGPGSATGVGVPGVSGSNVVGQITRVKKIQFGPYGMSPVTNAVFIEDDPTNTAQFRLTPNGDVKTLADPGTFADSPVPADVRIGTLFNFGNNVGTCAVPLAGQTVVGVPVDDTIGTAVLTQEQLLATLQPNPTSVATRSIEDTKPLTFSWPNSTDTITGEVSIDNGAYAPVEGAITYLREEDGKHYFTLVFDAADRPAEEGTARYIFTSGSYTMYATLRTVRRSLSITEVERTGGMLQTLAAKFVGITFIRDWFGAIFGSAADADTLAEINATTAATTYTNLQHSLQAQRENADDVWVDAQQALQDLQDHGDEVWADAGALAQRVIFSASILDGLVELPVNGVQMTVAGRTRFTGTDGTVSLRLNPGTYDLAAIAPPGYDFIDDIEFVVPEVDAGPVEVDVPLSFVPVEIPTGAPVCMCTIIAIDQHGDPAVAANIIATTSSKSIQDGELFVFNIERPFDTDDRGYVVMPLLRGQRYEITVEYGDAGSTTVKRTIPDASTYRITVQL